MLATVDGVPAALGGGFRVRDGWMQVVAMWTDPAYRRRGLAVQVLDVVVAAARAEGRRLVLDVAQGNSAARNAYERLRLRGDGRVRADPAGHRRPGGPDGAAGGLNTARTSPVFPHHRGSPG